MNKVKEPIIIIGMHRSGTSMLSRLVSQMGVFMGNELDKNAESIYFQNLNSWMLKMAKSSWDFPTNFAYVDENYKNQVSRVMSNRLNSIQFYPYWGVKKYTRRNTLGNYTWGWKDPSNSITLDIWLELFPKAKILHIYRNPVDVSESLTSREIKRKEKFNLNIRTRLREKILSSNIIYQRSYYALDLKNSFELWKQYNDINQQNVLKYKNQVKSIKYEDLLLDPAKNLESIVSFLGIEVNKARINKIVSNIDASRAYSFKQKPELVNFYNEIKEDGMVSTLGYSNII